MEIKKDVSYLNKDFGQFRKNLIDFTKQYFPTTYTDFNESFGNYTIPSTINREFFLVANTGTGTVTFPTPVVGQIITIRNQTSGNITLSASGYTFFPVYGGVSGFVNSWTMPTGNTQRFYFYSTYWMGMN
jgi:hypothetical protein